MAKISLFPSGSLDLDSDINKLASGDYPDAKNIIVSASKSGGGGTIKMLESIKALPLPTMAGLHKASFKAPSGDIYYLFRTDATTATIYKVAADLSAITTIITYTHTVTVDFVPDLKLIGENIVWNYYGTGQLLYWLSSRTPGASIPGADLLFVKTPPINALTVTKVITSNAGQSLLEKGDFQFCSRYKYDNGEYSVLSAYTEMFKGKKDTYSYTVAVSTAGKPTYAKAIEIYVRSGDFGTLRRIATFDISAGGSPSISWKGDVYESLSDEDSTRTFSAVPYEVGSIEVAVDRVIVGNFTDDYANDSVGSLVITPATGYVLGSGGSIKNYLNSGTTDAAINSNENGTYYKPFANNSTYSVGVLLFDHAMKTRGVEFVSTFQTGKFAGPIAPVFNINTSGYTKPSYAKYMQLAITKNLSKSKIYEGFASSIYFELEYDDINKEGSKIEKISKNKLSVLGTDVNKVKYLVVDLNGMYNAEEIYSYQQGDRITINVPSTTSPTTDADGEQTGSYRILDMPIVYADSQKVFCTWNGGECLNDAIPDPDKLYFEIYSTRTSQEDGSVLFYAVGDVIDISAGIPSSITNYKIGDTVFKKFSFNKYTKPVLQKGYSKSVPAVVNNQVRTEIFSAKVAGDSVVLNTTQITATSSSASNEFYIPLDTSQIPFYDDGKFVDGAYRPKGYFDDTLNLSVSLYLDYVSTVIFAEPLVQGNIQVFCSLEKVPFDQSKGTFGTPIRIGNEVMAYYKNYETDINEILTSEGGLYEPTNFKPSSESQYLNSGDKLKLKIRTEVFCTAYVPIAEMKLEVKNKSGFVGNALIVLQGNRTQPVIAYFAKDSVPISVTKTDFAVRAMSNTVNFGQWNTSAGSAFVKASEKFSARRTNAIRHGGNIVYGTEVNNIGQFSVANTYEVPIENGAILSIQRASRLQGNGDMLLAICENETSYILLGESSSNQASNYELSAGVDSIIGSIRNLGERTGIQDRSSVYNYNGTVYWWDNARSILCKFTQKGVDIISKKKVRSYFIKQDGIAKFAFDPFYNLLFVKIGEEPAIAFDVDEDAWKSFYDIEFDSSLHIGDRMICLSAGKLYRSLENATGNKEGEFMGVAYPGTISLVANSGVPIMPTNVVIGHNMDVINYANPNYVKSTLFELAITNENGQETSIVEGNFTIEDNKLFAFVMRDELSAGGIINGDFVRGYTNTFTLKLKDNTQLNRIFELEIEVDKVTGH